MAIIYKVIIEPTIENKEKFCITWLNMAINKKESFNGSPLDIMLDDMGTPWQQSRHQLEIGQKLFRFLDGDSRYLRRALDEAKHKGEPLHLHLNACQEVADWPFELLAYENTFLLLQELHLFRRVSDWGEEKVIPPENRPLKLLFMASSTLDREPELDYEREEETIFKITEKLAINMEVEDSGSLQGLRNRLQDTEFDVIHLSGHAGIETNGIPYFIMESETGEPCKISPAELWDKALIDYPPRLLFLSGCRTGEEQDNNATASFAHLMVGKYEIPAVLGWGRPVSDNEAIQAESIFYSLLSRGQSIPDAIQRARRELVNQSKDEGTDSSWPLLRLYCTGMPLGAMVTAEQKYTPKPRNMVHTYLEDSQVQVLKEGFVGRRRQLQQSLFTLMQNPDKIGLLLLGTGGLGKSCLAGKICERFPKHTIIVVRGFLDTSALEEALRQAFIISQEEKGQQILSETISTIEKLKKLCATVFKEKNYLLLLDDFEQNFEPVEKDQPVQLKTKALELLSVLLQYLRYSLNMTKMIITCRQDFSITGKETDKVEEKLEKIWLTGFHEGEQRKKGQYLNNITNFNSPLLLQALVSAGRGNPELMEWIDEVMGTIDKSELPQLAQIIQKKQKEFVLHYGFPKLLQQGGKKLVNFLRILSIFQLPVMERGVQRVAEKGKLKEWRALLKQGIGLSVIEYDQTRHMYQVTPHLREELLAQLKKREPYHEVACLYYQEVCKSMTFFDPILINEWIGHALECGEETVATEQGALLVKYLRECHDFEKAKKIGLWILEEKKQPLNDQGDASLLNEIALTLKYMGDFGTAIHYFEKVLAINRGLYGESHPIIARDLNNLGSAWRVIVGPEKIMGYFKQGLDIINNAGGEEKHPVLVANLLNNLGSVCDGMGFAFQAIEYYQQVLSIWKKLFGESDSRVAITLNNLAAAYTNLGKFEKAAAFYKQALSIDRFVYGKINQEVAADLNNLGGLCDDQKNYSQAIEYYKEALNIWQEIYTTKHKNTAVTLSNLGKAYFLINQKEKGKIYLQDAYDILKELLGAEHEHTQSVEEWLQKCF